MQVLWSHCWALIQKSVKLNKENFIRNIHVHVLKKLIKICWKINSSHTKTDKILIDNLGSLVSFVYIVVYFQKTNKKVLEDHPVKNSYHVWFQLAQCTWFQRRLKCERLTGTKWWQYLTWHFGSGELKIQQ
jgi:hypothetical protein